MQAGTDIDGTTDFDNFGISITFSDDANRLAVGATTNGAGTGYVRIYDWNGSSWVQAGSDITGEAVGDSFGWEVDLSADGNRLAISAKDNDGNGADSGHVRIYDWDGSSWTQFGVDIDGEAADDQSGFAIALTADGLQLAIGAFQNDGNGADSGHVRVYQLASIQETISYTENDPATIIYPEFSITDIDDTNMESATIVISGNYVNGEDVLAFVDTGTITGTWTAATGTLVLTGADSKANYQLALASVTYENLSENPSTLQRQVDFYVNDGDDQSNTVAVLIDVAAVNDPPVNSVPGAQNTPEDTDLVFNVGNSNLISISDDDATNAEVSLSVLNGILTLSQVTGLTFSSGGNGEGSMTFSGTIVDINNALNGLIYSPDDNYNGADTLTIDTNDLGETGTGGIQSDIDNISITISPVNDAPELGFVKFDQVGSDIDGEAGSDISGVSIDASDDGSRIVIGAPGNNGTTGHVRIYELQLGVWTQLGSDIDGEAAGDLSGFSVAMNADGSRVIIGAYGNNALQGHARIFEWDGSSWSQVGLDIDGEVAGDQSGHAVSISSDGNTVAIGARSNDDFAADSGHVRIFNWDGSSWNQVGLDIDGEAANDFSGWAVDLSADGMRVAISARNNDGTANESGHVRVFEWDGAAWNQLGSDIDGEALNDLSGHSIDLSDDGTTLAIGAIQNDGSAPDSGHVRVFEWDGATWNQLGSDIDGEAADDWSGWSVSLSEDGSRLAIGASENDGNGSNSGQVRIYEWNPDSSDWTLLGINTVAGSDIDGEAAEDKLGRSVVLSADGTRVFAGAPFNDDAPGSDGGSVRVFDLISTLESATYTEGGGPVVLYPEISIIDVDDTNMESATVTITNFQQGDYLDFSVSLATSLGISSSFYVGSTGELLFTGTATIAEYESLLATVEFLNNKADPDTTNRIIEFVVNDGDDDSNVATINLTVNAVNNDPSVELVDFEQVGADIVGEAASDVFGDAVSFNASGTVLAVGASNNDGNGANSGHVRIYDWDGTNWVQRGNDIDGEAAGDNSGNKVVLSATGDSVAISAIANDAGGNNRGHVRIFDWDGSNWVQRGSDIDGDADFDLSGTGLSFSSDGNVVAISALLHSGPGAQTGQLRLFYWDGFNWQQRGADIYGEASETSSIRGVDLNGDGTTVVVGEDLNDAGGLNRGQARVYDWDGIAWVQRGLDIEGLANSDELGSDVAITADGDSIAILTKRHATGTVDSGYAVIYDWDGASWVQRGAIIEGEADDDTLTNGSIDISADGSIVVIGAKSNDGGGFSSGHSRIYHWNGTSWVQWAVDIDGQAAGDLSGQDVSLSGDGTRLAIGEQGAASNGQVRVFDITILDVDPTSSPIPSLDYTEGDGAQTLHPQFSILDFDDADMESATIAITNNYVQGEDVLDFSDTASITGVWNATTGVLVLSGTDSKENYEIALASVTYQNNSDTPDTNQRTVSFFVDDGDALSTAATTRIDITAVNDPPEVEFIIFNQQGADIQAEAADDRLGRAVSMSLDGSRVAVASHLNDGNGASSGHVRVFDWDGTNWVQAGADIDGEAAFDQSGNSISLSSDGLRLAIGADFNDGNGADSGHVRVYEWDGSAWNQLGIDLDGEAAGDEFGGSVALNSDGSRLAVGAVENNSGQGHTRIFEWDGSAWNQLGLDLDGEAIGDNFGNSVALSADGNRVAIGATLNDDAGANRGHVRLYDWNGTAWVQVGLDIDGEANQDQSGSSVTLSADGSRVAIGAIFNDGNGANSGHVRVYEFNGANWIQIGSDIDGEAATDESGNSISFSADGLRLAIGAGKNDNINGTQAGHVRIYDWDGSDWVQIGFDIDGPATDEIFGFDVAMSGDGEHVAIGAHLHDGIIGLQSGLVRVFELTSVTSSLNYTENDGAVILATEFDVSDVDDTDMESATIAITGNFTQGEDFLSFTNTANISGSYDSSTGILNLVGTDTKAAYESALASITYENTSDDLSILQRTVQFTVNDGDSQSNIATVTINMTAVNDAPELDLIDFEQLGLDIAGDAAGDQSGRSVSLSSDGQRMAVGSWLNDDGGLNSGHVRIFEWDGSAWNQLGLAIAGEAASDISGYSISLSANGSRVAIGGSDNDGNGSDAGHVRIYDWDSSAWNQVGSDIDGEAADDNSGFSISLSNDGSTLAIGAIGNDGNGVDSGHVRIYQFNGTAWVQMGSDIDGESANDFAGRVSLSSDGKRVAIGGILNDGNGADSGHVRIYEWNGSDWSQLGLDIDGENAGDGSGISMALNADGSRVVIGAWLNADAGAASGHVRIYDWDGSAWNQVGSDIDGEAAGDRSGASVSISEDGERIAIGAYLNDGNGIDSGHVRIYDFNGTDWAQIGGMDIDGEAAGDNSAVAVSLSADGARVAIGATLNGDGGAQSGHVRVYELVSVLETLAYTENDPATIIHPEFSVSDLDDTDMESATIAITSNFVSGEDILNFTNTANITGIWSATTGVLTLIGTDTKAAYEAALASITYENISDNPSTSQRQVDFYVNDGDDQSNVATVNIDITAATDAPELELIDFEQLGADIHGEAANDQSGWSVSANADGTRIAIGAHENAGNGALSGHVRIYELIAGVWAQMGADIDGEAAGDRSGHSVSLNADGTRVAIGAISNADNGVNSGHVRIFEWDGSSWNQLGVDIDGEDPANSAGWSVDLNSDGTRVAIGANSNDDIGSNVGHVQIYEYNGTNWIQLGLDIDGEAVDDESGSSVSFNASGTRVAIGATGNDAGGATSGHVRIYDWSGSSWVQVGADIDGEAADDESGYSIALSADGSRVAIGARFNDDGGANSGHVRVYELIAGVWTQIGSDLDGEAAGDQSGRSVSLSADGQRLAIGALYNDGNGADSGHVRVYDWDGSNWQQIGGMDIDGEALGDQSGISVSLSLDGKRLVIGSNGNDDNGFISGQVRVYDLVSVLETITYTENDPVMVIHPEFSITDPDDTDMESATIAITGNYVQGEDRLTFVDTVNITGTFNSITGILTLIGTDTKLAYEQALASVTYHNTSDNPSTLQRSVDFYVNDGDLQSNLATVLIDVVAVNDAPDLSLVNLLQQLGSDIDAEAAEDRFGISVATNLDGSRIVVGAALNDGTGPNAGHARVFDWNGTNWVQVGSDIDGELAGDNSGTAVAMSDDGMRIAIGADLNDGAALTAGHVRVFEWDGSSWNQLGLDIDGEAANDESGSHISMSADGFTVAIGATFNNASAGHVRIYDWDGSSWNQRGLDIDALAGDESGVVAMSSDGNRIIVGRPLNDVGDTNSGQAVIYDWDGTNWTQVGATIDGANFEGRFGITVSISADGNRVAIGEDRFDGGPGGNLVGYTYVYDWNGTNWVQAGTEIPGDGVGDDSYYMSLSSDGERLAIGGPFNNANGSDSGHVRIYDWNGSTLDWVLIGGSDIVGEAAGDRSGSSVVLSADGKRVVIGAALNADTGSNAGHVRVYELVSISETISYNEGDGDIVIYDEFSITDIDDDFMESATVTITPATYQGGEDYLAFNTTYATSIGVSGNFFNGVLTFTSDTVNTVTKSEYELLLATVTYENTSSNPDTTQRVVEYLVNDGDANSNIATVMIDVTAVNNAPDLDLIIAAQQLGADIDGEAVDDESGYSVSFSADGSIVAIGAAENDAGGAQAGHVRIFQWDGSSWNQLGADIDGDSALDNTGYSVSLSSDGLTVAIGSPVDLVNGSVSVYNWDGSSWNLVGAKIVGEAAGDNFGSTVYLNDDGTRLAISGPSNDGAGVDLGHIRVYEYDGNAWIQLGGDIDGLPTGGLLADQKGIAFTADGNRIAVAERFSDVNGIDSGQVRVYDFDGANWVQAGLNLDGSAAGEQYGFSVSLSSDGNRLAIGGISYDVGPGDTNEGYVQTFDWNGAAWVQVGSDIIGNIGGELAGGHVSLSSDGQRLVVGATGNDDNGIDAGQVRIYDFNGTDWVQVSVNINGETAADLSGYIAEISADGKRVAISSVWNDDAGNNAGHVRIFEFVSISETVSYSEGDGVVPIYDEFSITDADDDFMESAIVSMTLATYNGAEDVLSFSSVLATTIGVTGNVVGNVINFTSDVANTVTKAEYEALFATISYENTSMDPDTTPREVHYTVDDGDDVSNIATVLINVAGVNNPPVLELIDFEQLGSDIDGEAADDGSGSSVSLSSDGTRAAVGAFTNDGNGNNSGHVRIY
ncbi:MAG: hypothetical protein EP298_09785, partial [Gammaproteobacteria bacterium]